MGLFCGSRIKKKDNFLSVLFNYEITILTIQNLYPIEGWLTLERSSPLTLGTYYLIKSMFTQVSKPEGRRLPLGKKCFKYISNQINRKFMIVSYVRKYTNRTNDLILWLTANIKLESHKNQSNFFNVTFTVTGEGHF